jgi:cytochrome c oxidase subunit II
MTISPFNPSSPQALAITHLFLLMLVIAGLIFALVTGLVVYIAVRYRAGQNPALPFQNFGQPKLEIVWTVGSLLILVVLFGFTVTTMHKADPPVSHTQPDLIVIGHQWWWEVHYPKSGVVAANEIHVPVGRRWLVRLESADVIHDFWVPQLGRKMDMVPGHPNHIWLEPTRPGTYLGACSEFCGAQHGWMRFRVIAQPPAEFDAWQAAQRRPAPAITTAAAAQGANIFEQRTCVNCHAIGGTAAAARIAPDLTHLASRETIGAGVLPNTPANLAAWLADPQAIKPGSHMPNLHLSGTEVRALVAYMETLR